MTVFSGKIDPRIKKTVYKRRSRLMALIVSAFLLVFGGGMIAIVFFDGAISQKERGYVSSVLIMMALCAMLALWLFAAPYSKKEAASIWEYKIRINSENVTAHNITEDIRYRTPVEKIRKVEDMGEYYLLRYALIDCFICQKDLLTSGSLEELERIFEGKIKRK